MLQWHLMRENLQSSDALSPLDGRYGQIISPLRKYYTEGALIAYRIRAEIAYLLFLSHEHIIPSLSPQHNKQLQNISSSVTLKDIAQVKKYELETKHDVKAVEYYLRMRFKRFAPSLLPYIHIGLTSEDINSIAHGWMLVESRDEVMLASLKKVLDALVEKAETNRDTTMLARTHGQVAVPTTVGKELIIFAVRLAREMDTLASLPVEAKLSGAVGNFNALNIAFPSVDWITVSQKFIRSIGLSPQLFTAQTIPAETYSTMFQCYQRINTVLLDLCQDMWRYVSDGYFQQKATKGQIGSSTMPQKINPINFENAEGNLGLANTLLAFFVAKLPVSRLQRDLSDSTVKRSIGSAMGYSLLAYASLSRGLGAVSVNRQLLAGEVAHHWEVLAEAVQTLLRVWGKGNAYEQLRILSQGKQWTEESFHEYMNQLPLTTVQKKHLHSLTPGAYYGHAGKLVDAGIAFIKERKVYATSEEK